MASFLALFILALALAVRGATPFNPPAVPLAVRSPFHHIWLNTGNGTSLNARWPTLWSTLSSTTAVRQLTTFARRYKSQPLDRVRPRRRQDLP